LPPATQEAAPDQDIIDKLKEGATTEAFEMLVNRFDERIFRLCFSILRDTGLAEDAAQDSLVRIWRALPRFDGRARLSTWIYTITRNRALTARGRRRELSLPEDAGAGQDLEREDESAARLDPVAPAAADEDQSVLLRRYVDALPERFRRAMLLYYFEDQNIEEVAAMLGAEPATVKTWLHRGRALLTEGLRAAGLADPALWLEEEHDIAHG
jgi:RNA polymerase sigma-70 factor, ECF subfamily